MFWPLAIERRVNSRACYTPLQTPLACHSSPPPSLARNCPTHRGPFLLRCRGDPQSPEATTVESRVAATSSLNFNPPPGVLWVHKKLRQSAWFPGNVPRRCRFEDKNKKRFSLVVVLCTDDNPDLHHCHTSPPPRPLKTHSASAKNELERKKEMINIYINIYICIYSYFSERPNYVVFFPLS